MDDFDPEWSAFPVEPPEEAERAGESQERAQAEPPIAAPLKVAILGTAPSSRLLAPFHDPSFEIWACSPPNKDLPRISAFFELHALVELLNPAAREDMEPYINWLCEQKFPVFMQEKNVTVPNAVPLPKDELLAEHGPHFMNSSVSWMVAYALKLGAKEIEIYGVDMAANGEYATQRAGLHYFFYEARRRGVTLKVPQESDLLRPPPLYGYHDSTWIGRKLTIRKYELERRVALAEQKFRAGNNEICFLRGALSVSPDNEEMKTRVAALEAEMQGTNNEIFFIKGALDDLQYVRRTWVD